LFAFFLKVKGSTDLQEVLSGTAVKVKEDLLTYKKIPQTLFTK
jgi:hypothetical protein